MLQPKFPKTIKKLINPTVPVTHHIHMVEIDSEFWKRHLAFRNYLSDNPKEKLEYYVLKKIFASKDWKDGNEYAVAKTEFIINIEQKATYNN